MKKKKLRFLTVCMVCLMAVSGCGNTESEETAVPVQEKEEEPVAEPEDESEDEGKKEEEAAPEPEPEEEKVLTYAEEKEQKFNDETSVTISGVRRNPENQSDFDVIDSDWEISEITVKNSEDGKVITVEQKVSGYIWGNDDGSVFKTDISLPGGLFCDIYTGAIIPATNMVEDMQTEHTTEIEWDGKTYTIKREESAKWEDGEWGPNPEGEGYVLLSTLYITNILTVSNDYDGLAMILSPLTGVSDSDLENAGVINEEEKYILDVLEDDGYLFSIAKAYESLNGVSMAEATKAVDETGNTGASSSNTKTTNSEKSIKEMEVSDTRQNVSASAETVHKHDYTSTVTKEPGCGENGVKTFACACGDSYTESIPALGHQWVQKTEVVNHPSQGHMETQRIEKTIYYCLSCEPRVGFDTLGELQDHQAAMIEVNGENYDGEFSADDFEGSFFNFMEEVTHFGHVYETTWEDVNTWVVDSEAWDETVTYNVCSVCGAKQ